MKIGIVGDQHLQETPPRSRKDDYFAQCLAELDYVLSENDYTIMLGDLFHRPSLNDESKQELANMLLKHRMAKKRIHSIVGNHDIFNMNMSSLARGSLGLMAKVGLLKLIGSEQIEGLLIETIEMKRKPTVPTTEYSPSILLGHVFFESSLDPKMSITREQVEKCGFDYLFLGHDHEPYKPMQFGKTIVMRPGSLCRNTSHAYNLNRQPCYVQLVLEQGKIVSVETKEVPAPLPSEIFNDDAFKKPNSSTYAFVQNVQEILKGFERMAESKQAFTLRKALEEVKAPEPVQIYLKSLHERALINYV